MFKKYSLLFFAVTSPTFANSEKVKKKDDHSKTSVASKKLSSEKLSENQDCSKLAQESKVELWNKANCFFKKKDRLASIGVLQKIYTEYPEEALEAFILSSNLYWEEGTVTEPPKREDYYKNSLKELEKASAQYPKHWRIFTELGDHYALREQKPEMAQSYYQSAHELYGGNAKAKVPEASGGQKSSIEDRIARNSEALDRRGDAVTATCLSLYFDPDNEEAQNRLNRLGGACKRKNFRPKTEGPDSKSGASEAEEKHHE